MMERRRPYFYYTATVTACFLMWLRFYRLGDFGQTPPEVQAQTAHAAWRAALTAQKVYQVLVATSVYLGTIAVLWGHALFWRTGETDQNPTN